jgi:CBS domain-containing protein
MQKAADERVVRMDQFEAARKRIRRGAESLGDLLSRGRERMPSIEFTHRKERSMFDVLLNRFTVGFAAGYVLGARAGRERYNQIARWWSSFSGSPTVQQATERGRELVTEAGRAVSERLPARGSQSIRDVMTPDPQTVRPTAKLSDVARQMRDSDLGAMIVVDATSRVVGIVTDRDIAVRAVADGKDLKTATVSDVLSEDLITVSPTDTVDQAVRLMRERAVRRLPVVEAGRPVGIVSIGDLAVERDPRSALADISAAPPPKK